jgi:transposase-like protein
MSKLVTGSRPCEVAAQSTLATIQIPLPLASALMDAKQGLLDLVVSTGLQVFEAMLEEDREALCGPKRKRVPERSATGAGRTRDEVTLGGRRIVLPRPRVRSGTAGELTLPSFAFAAGRDPLDDRTLEAIALGVSNRDYRRSLDAVPESLGERSVSRSAVSRRFVALSAQQLAAWMSQPLADLDLRVVQIDGIHFHEHVVLIALGIDAEGQKHVLGLREGTTENATVVRVLLADLLDRGLSPDRPLLFGLDGAKALRKAITTVFGNSAIVQRCQVHKRRNVLEHLPERMRPSVRKAMQQA